MNRILLILENIQSCKIIYLSTIELLIQNVNLYSLCVNPFKDQEGF